MIKTYSRLAALAGLLCSSSLSVAALMGYTDVSQFNTATSGYTQTGENFDGLSSGSTIADGGAAGGFTFNYPTLAGSGENLQVRNDGDTTSSSNFLGTSDGGVFQDSDNLNIAFSATNAIGMYFLATDELLDGDIRLLVGTTYVDLLTTDIVDTLADGTDVYFLGLVDETSTFTSVDILTDHDGSNVYFTWNIDDIITATAPSKPRVGGGSVPEPASALLLGIGMLGGGLVYRKRPRKQPA